MKKNRMANGLVVIASVLGITIAATACSGSRHVQTRANRTSPTPRPASEVAVAQSDALMGLDPAMAKLSYDQRLEYGFQHGYWNGVVGGVVVGPGKIATSQLPGARVPQVWRDFDFKVESYTGRGHPYTIGSTITLRSAVAKAVVNGVNIVQELDAGEPVIQPGDHLLVFYAPGDLGGGNTSSRIVVPRASFVDVIRDGAVYPEAKAPPGISPAVPEPVGQFLAHVSG
jgi:hypothetical protein